MENLGNLENLGNSDFFLIPSNPENIENWKIFRQEKIPLRNFIVFFSFGIFVNLQIFQDLFSREIFIFLEIFRKNLKFEKIPENPRKLFFYFKFFQSFLESSKNMKKSKN